MSEEAANHSLNEAGTTVSVQNREGTTWELPHEEGAMDLAYEASATTALRQEGASWPAIEEAATRAAMLEEGAIALMNDGAFQCGQ